MFGLGKPESKFGKFLRKHGIKQADLVDKSGVNKSTVSKLSTGDAFKPSLKNAQKIIKALRSMTGKDIDHDDFWTF